MTAAPAHDVRRVSIRVALAATGLVAVAYFIVAVAVVAAWGVGGIAIAARTFGWEPRER